MKKAKIMIDVEDAGFVDIEYDFSKGKRGAIDPIGAGKTRITIRIDDEVLEWFRNQVHQAGGGNYQSSINEALKAHIHKQHEPLESTLRRVLREELGLNSK
ncbi:MAG: BrnA antitoxin family protein [Chamaesiphon sp.]|nr:BrnA antitoxin family protein [Chamaesiphon sp.]